MVKVLVGNKNDASHMRMIDFQQGQKVNILEILILDYVYVSDNSWLFKNSQEFTNLKSNFQHLSAKTM